MQVLIASYETFRIHAERFAREGTCDLLICDEAHRLKNDQTLTNKVHARGAERAEWGGGWRTAWLGWTRRACPQQGLCCMR